MTSLLGIRITLRPYPSEKAVRSASFLTFLSSYGQDRRAKVVPQETLFFCHFFSQLLCQWNQLFIVLRLHDNPSVTASPCHLPLHKGGFGAVRNRTFRTAPNGVSKCALDCSTNWNYTSCFFRLPLHCYTSTQSSLPWTATSMVCPGSTSPLRIFRAMRVSTVCWT